MHTENPHKKEKYVLKKRKKWRKNKNGDIFRQEGLRFLEWPVAESALWPRGLGFIIESYCHLAADSQAAGIIFICFSFCPWFRKCKLFVMTMAGIVCEISSSLLRSS